VDGNVVFVDPADEEIRGSGAELQGHVAFGLGEGEVYAGGALGGCKGWSWVREDESGEGVEAGQDGAGSGDYEGQGEVEGSFAGYAGVLGSVSEVTV
jgi:hypothetical protein